MYKPLSYFLPVEVKGYVGCEVMNYLDCEVVEEIDGCTPGNGWPGKEKNVYWWYKLANGKMVGFNENPSRGWSFPVIGKRVRNSK